MPRRAGAFIECIQALLTTSNGQQVQVPGMPAHMPTGPGALSQDDAVVRPACTQGRPLQHCYSVRLASTHSPEPRLSSHCLLHHKMV